VIADGATLTNIVNGVVVNRGDRVYPTAGKIQLQSEGAEIYYRRIELTPIDHAQTTSRAVAQVLPY
jgi:3-keto-disaccharide hydrolase